MKGTNMVFVFDMFRFGWRMTNNQNCFGDNWLLSLCMGLNHPQKLFLMPDSSSKTIWLSKSFRRNFRQWTFGLRWCLSSSQKEILLYNNCHMKDPKNDNGKILSKSVCSDGECIFLFTFLKNKYVWQMMLCFHLLNLVVLHETKDVSTNCVNLFRQIRSRFYT